MPREHHYDVRTVWTGNIGGGTRDYQSYGRQHEIRINGKPPIAGSADPAFRGDPSRANPEELLVAALSACHMLWYLHLCADAGVVVTAYEDDASGDMIERRDGGQFEQVVLRPRVTITADSDAATAESLHQEAHSRCFIANSVNFPVTTEITIQTAKAA